MEKPRKAKTSRTTDRSGKKETQKQRIVQTRAKDNRKNDSERHVTAVAKGRTTAELIEELQVRQVELELQNEELHAAQAHLEDALSRYNSLFHDAPVGYMELDAKGVVIEVNRTLISWLGCEADALVGRNISLVIADDAKDQDAWLLHWHKLRQDAPRADCVLRVRRADGSLLPVAIESAAVESSGGFQGCRSAWTDISARRKAEQDQEGLERRFRTTFENAAVGMAHGAPDGSFLRVNARLCEITGYSEEELLSRTFMDITHPEDVNADDGLARRLARREIPDYQREKRYLRKDGTVVWVRVTVAAGCDHNGQLEFFIAVVEDVSDLKEAQKREAATTAHAAASRAAMATVDAMGEGVAVCSSDGLIRDVNPAFVALADTPAEALKGKDIREVFPNMFEESRSEVLEKLANIRLRDTIRPEDALTVMAHGGVRKWVVPTLTVMRDAESDEIGLVLTVRDISALVEAQASLREREREYRELVENANSIIIRITPDHRVTFLNEYAQAFFGYAPDEILGRSVIGTIIPSIDSEGRDLRQMIEAIAANPEVHGSNDNENIRKDGSRVWIHWSNRAIRDEQGRVKEILCVGTDMTERRRLEREAATYRSRLRALADRLAATEEQSRRRVATHIHDTVVQTLSLSNIRLGGVVAALEKAGMPDQRERVEGVRLLLDQGTKECRGLMDELVPSLLYEVGLHAALKDFVEKQGMTDGTRISVEADDHPPPMDDGMRGLLFQSARELVMNALKHAGGGEIRISVSSAGEHVQLRVQDTGRGFDLAKLDGKGHDEHGGFGLFNVRERLQGLGGTLDIQSQPDKGTTARITVPLPSEVQP